MESKAHEPKNQRTKRIPALVVWFFGSWFFCHSAVADESPVPTAVVAHLDDKLPPLRLGHRAANDLPTLTDEELGTTQQQALLTALAGDPYGHRAADQACAGCSMLLRPHAICSNPSRYGGYWVGGGKPCRGDSPFLDEGTFGWDYFGILFTKRVALNWSHGRQSQGGAGAYKTDGPKLK
jgi:hypothetical protein